MKVAVIGSRGFDDYDLMKQYLDKLHKMQEITCIVSGGAKGADTLAEKWADENGVPKCVYEAKWDDLTHPDARIKVNFRGKKYDANAGFRRNYTIVESADVVIAFHMGGSPGTQHSIDYAKKIGTPIKVINV